MLTGNAVHGASCNRIRDSNQSCSSTRYSIPPCRRQGRVEKDNRKYGLACSFRQLCRSNFLGEVNAIDTITCDEFSCSLPIRPEHNASTGKNG